MTTDRGPDDEPSADGGPDDSSPWAELLADAESIADEYRADGWTVERLRTRDVAPWRTDEEPAGDDAAGGFLTLVGDESFDEIEARVAEGTFASAEVYRRRVGDAVLAIAVELDAPTETAVVVPLYYRPEEARAALDAAGAAGELQVRVRPEGRDDWLTFVHDDPELFEPDDPR
ncbi:hypothetical protein [Halovivax sp.]|uniref:DUF7529 family protein n=1 Tax=Halovivax sp. TaxID=1935978 RepID=UPI0025C6B912|nr:hypothetical protein [Halovivax sp.]